MSVLDVEVRSLDIRSDWYRGRQGVVIRAHFVEHGLIRHRIGDSRVDGVGRRSRALCPSRTSGEGVTRLARVGDLLGPDQHRACIRIGRSVDERDGRNRGIDVRGQERVLDAERGDRIVAL